MRQILRKDRPRSWSVLRIDQLRLAWSPPEWVVSDLMLPNRRSLPSPHGISKRTMCGPTRLQFRGRLTRLGEMSEDGTVTLPCEKRERATPYGFSSRRDGLAPRGHRRGA